MPVNCRHADLQRATLKLQKRLQILAAYDIIKCRLCNCADNKLCIVNQSKEDPKTLLIAKTTSMIVS